MISIDPTVLIVMGEAIVGLIVVVAVIVTVMIKRQRRTKALLAELENRLRQSADERQAAYENMLGDLFEEEEGEDGANVAQGMVAQENEFYGRLIEMYMKRNSSTLRKLDQHMEEFSASYTDVIAAIRGKIEEGAALEASELTAQLQKMAEEHEIVAKEMDEVRAENARLSHDLEQAYKEIDHAMTEYNAAFRGPTAEEQSTPRQHSDGVPPPPPPPEPEAPVGVADQPAVVEHHDEPRPQSAADTDEDALLAQWNEALDEAGAQQPDEADDVDVAPGAVSDNVAVGETAETAEPSSSVNEASVPAAGLLSVEDEIPSRDTVAEQSSAGGPSDGLLSEPENEPVHIADPSLNEVLSEHEEDALLAELDALGIGNDDLPELGDLRTQSPDIIELADEDDLPAGDIKKS